MLHYYPRLGIFFAKFSGRTPLALAEKTVKIGQCVKSAGVADLRNGFVRIYQFACGMPQTDIHDILRQSLAGT